MWFERENKTQKPSDVIKENKLSDAVIILYKRFYSVSFISKIVNIKKCEIIDILKNNNIPIRKQDATNNDKLTEKQFAALVESDRKINTVKYKK
jgi:intein-encoded DNA endonuclease-like protein